jgi:hypothetical protein
VASTPTPTPADIAITGGGGPDNPTGNLPLGQDPSTPLDNFPTPVVLSGLGIILLLVMIAILFRSLMVGSTPSAPSQIHEFGEQGWTDHGGVFAGRKGLFKKFALFGHSVNTDTTGLGEIKGNDEVIGLGGGQNTYIGRNDGRLQQSTGTAAHELGHNPGLDHDGDGLSDTWESNGSMDANTDGQSDSSSSMRKPPDSA